MDTSSMRDGRNHINFKKIAYSDNADHASANPVPGMLQHAKFVHA